jgi:two-component sensor histidine kinase
MCAEVAAPEADVVVRRSGRVGTLSAEVATPLSMVLTELVQNAVEHAFPQGPGTIDVRAERADGVLTLSVEDDGRGLPADFALGASKRLGLQIVRTLVEGELQGALSLTARDGGGTVAAVRLPLAAPEQGSG